jgi:two-component sensor histidine kinase
VQWRPIGRYISGWAWLSLREPPDLEGPTVASPPARESEETALSLTMAVVTASPGPLLMLDGDLNIVAASSSFCAAFEIDAASAPGQQLSALGSGEWNVPQLRSLLDATRSRPATIEACEMDLERRGLPSRHLIVQAQRLVYLDLEDLRLLIAVSDVTEARESEKRKDEALRQNRILLEEVRHRVSNSLQIIASVLLQNARKTQSEETRGHLQDAHHRVMSVAALERLLAGSGEGHVVLREYVSSLCDHIAGSIIGDTNQVSLSVTGGEGVVDARLSVSLGLMLTELVINAVKHAFPDGRAGKIAVSCEVRGPNWSLSVADDGVGMPTDPAHTRAGLGTSIIQALARQLQATIETSSAHPGTRVFIAHSQIGLVDADAGSDADTPGGQFGAVRKRQ